MNKNTFLIIFIFAICCKTKSKDFILCEGPLHPYYFPELSYEGGFYEIKKYYHSNYKTVSNGNNTGIVRVRFNVNCKGETGNFEVVCFSYDYEKTKLNKKIISQLIRLTKDLSFWIPAVNEDGNTVNSHKFFAFKINDGKLEDILPK